MATDPTTTAATEFPPNRPDIHTLSECRGGGCQAVHIDSLGWPVDAESAAVARLTRHKSGEWLCAHGRYYLCCDEPNCPYRNERVRNDQPATAAYGVRFLSDGSVAHPWNGRTQEQRAREYLAELRATYTRDRFALVIRDAPDEPWREVDE